MTQPEFTLNREEILQMYKHAVHCIWTEIDFIKERDVTFHKGFVPWQNRTDEKVPAIQIVPGYAPYIGYGIFRACTQMFLHENKYTTFSSRELSHVRMVAKAAMPKNIEYLEERAYYY